VKTSYGMEDGPCRGTIATVRDTLTSVFAEVDAWFDKPGEARAFRLPDGGWTVDEVLEHITLTNHYLLLVIRKSTGKALARAARRGPILEGESDLRLLDPIGERGSFPWARPDHMVPTGQRPSGEVRLLMRDQVRECLDILGRLGGGEGALHRVRMSVNECGRLDVYQWLQFLALHARRHLVQMSATEARYRAAMGED
jgi:DinB superfamily